MKATILTTEQIRNCEGREYNPQIWDKNIDSMMKYTDVVFYHVAKGDGYDYDRYFVEYTLPEGLRLLKSFSYSSTLTNGGFYRLDKLEVTEDGRTHSDLVKLAESGQIEECKQLVEQLATTKSFILSMGKFQLNGEQVLIGTNQQARNWMVERSTKYGIAFTKGF